MGKAEQQVCSKTYGGGLYYMEKAKHGSRQQRVWCFLRALALGHEVLSDQSEQQQQQ